jgi:NADPH:quinone reductase-like Zn-dependent oxidoreductase
MNHRVVRIHRLGGPEVLTLESAIGLNRSEAVYRSGKYLIPPKLPSLMGYEACGVIEALGSGVSGFGIGDRVCVLPNFRMGDYGVYADHAVVPANSLIASPSGLSPIEAASVWMQYFTAFGIVQAGRLAMGDFVLIPAASSSVGLAAIQIANWLGAEPIAMTRSSAKRAALLAQGARHVIASGECDVPAEVMRITGGRGAKVVFDPVGGAFVETLAKSMTDEGILIIYGSLSGEPTPYPHWSAALKGLSLRGWVAAQIWNHPQRIAHFRDLILRGLAGGQLRPVVAKTFNLDEIVAAHRYLESNQQVGKIIVTTG